ncbi:MAG TPA: VWA domain-containing protein [Candidatus Polarisedimenticolaceae bacterium]|nr:VWA domain-containing protein [Candidatus Polarisedimenticolaceae bacterium]
MGDAGAADRAVGLALLALAAWAPAAGAPPVDPEPIKVPNLSEQVEVRLVTIDVIALDGQDRTVPGLGKDAFQLYVDGKETPIDTLDVVCDDAPAPEPRTKKFGDWASPPDLASGTRRIVLAFDYLHLPTAICPDLDPPGPCMLHTQALEAFRSALAAKSDIHDEEIMVVALTGGLRVEQPFTKDRAAVLETLRRMEYDVTLWNGHFDPLTEYGMFRTLRVLTTLLHAVPGPKSVVLLTAGDGPTIDYDNDFMKLSASASDAQTRFYPVDCRGLSSRLFGPPEGWSRLASVTGGRVTAAVNDFTLGYARARRDLGCRYTIGFYDRHPEENKTHRLRVDSAKFGLKIYNAASYSFPSQKVRRAMAVEAAFVVPSMFSGGGMRATVFPLAPQSKTAWDALVAVDFPVPPEALAENAGAHEFGVVLARGREIAKQFSRTVKLRRKGEGNGQAEHRLTFLEVASLSPGTYGLTAVLSASGNADPFTAHSELTVPEIPARGPFIVGPIIGRPAGSDLVILGGENLLGAPSDLAGGPKSFRPLLVTESDRSEPLFALTRVCAWKKDAKKGPWRVTRRIGGDEDVTLDDEFSGSPKGVAACARYLDMIPVDRLGIGSHTFTATVGASSGVARFLLTP